MNTKIFQGFFIKYARLAELVYALIKKNEPTFFLDKYCTFFRTIKYLYKKEKNMEETIFIKTLRANSDKCRNMYELCLKLGIKNIGGNTYREIEKIASENNIVLSFNHLSKKISTNKKTQSLDELLVNGSTINSNQLKEKLILNGIKKYCCENCGCSEWLGKPIPLELHHINGVHNDNRLENLQILCRNCHGQTDTFCGKNTSGKKSLRGTPSKSKSFFLAINREYLESLLLTKTLSECAKELDVSTPRLKYWLKKLNIKINEEWKEKKIKEYTNKIAICENCGKPFIKKTNKQKYCSETCHINASRRKDLTKEKLILVLKECKSFLSAAKCFGVSDKCIVKWCKRFGLPTKKRELFNYLNGCLV